MKILSKTNNPKATKEIKERFSQVDPATIGHHLHYGFMDPKIKSMLKNVKVVGTAFTVKTNVNDSTLVHKAVSMAEENDVIVIDRTGDVKHACVGEMVAYAAKSRKISGIIVDGPCTDIPELREIGLPVFATGISPITTKLYGESGEINTTIQSGGVTINSGDLIVANDNGVLVLSQDIDYESVLLKAEKSEANEPNTKKLIDEGKTLSSITRADKLIEKHQNMMKKENS